MPEDINIITYIPVATEEQGTLYILAVRENASTVEIPIDTNNEEYQKYLTWLEEADSDGDN